MDQLITIGQIDASDTLGSSLHYAALNGKKKILKKALDKGEYLSRIFTESSAKLQFSSIIIFHSEQIHSFFKIIMRC